MLAPMKKILLAGRVSDKQRILDILQQVGLVHVEKQDPLPDFDPTELQREIERTKKLLDAIEKRPALSGILPPPGTPSRLVEEFQTCSQKLVELENSASKIKEEILKYAPWGRIYKKDIDELLGKKLNLALFVIDSSEKIAEINAELRLLISEINGKSYVFAVSRTPITAPPSALEVPFPERGTDQLEHDLKNLLDEIQTIRNHISSMGSRLDEIKEYYYSLIDKKNFYEVEKTVFQEGPIFILQGWLPSENVTQLQKEIEESKIPLSLHFEDPIEEENPPSKFQNPWWIRPIESMFSVLGVLPGYREFDISPYFFPFLILFSAMLIGDAGYGLICLLALALAYKPFKEKGAPALLLDLFLVLFTGTLVYGALTNNWFGVQLKLTSFEGSSPQGEQMLKEICFFVGAVHLTIAHAWKTLAKPLSLASISEVGWIMFIWAMRDLINMLVLGYSPPARMIPMFKISLLLVLLFTAPSKNIFSCIGQGLGAIALGAPGFLSDIISYIRLWAVGLAGGILAASFNQMAMESNFLVMLIILVGGHFMNIALGLIAVFAHGVRLNLLEFSNHLGMEWTGREYNPFRKLHKE